MTRCEKCGFDHVNPGSEEGAIKVLACALPEYTFVTRKGPVSKKKYILHDNEGAAL